MIAPKEKLKSYDHLLIKRTFTETSVMITFKDITAGIHFKGLHCVPGGGDYLTKSCHFV